MWEYLSQFSKQNMNAAWNMYLGYIYTIINAEMWTQTLDNLVKNNESGKDKQV